jgi:hypothetical protein
MQAQTTPGTGSQQPVPISNLGFTKSGLEMLDRFFNRNIFFISAAKRKEDEKPIEVLTKEHGMVKFANFNGEHPRRSFWALRAFFGPKESGFECEHMREEYTGRDHSLHWIATYPRDNGLFDKSKGRMGIYYIAGNELSSAYIIYNLSGAKRQLLKEEIMHGTKNKYVLDVLSSQKLQPSLIEKFISVSRKFGQEKGGLLKEAYLTHREYVKAEEEFYNKHPELVKEKITLKETEKSIRRNSVIAPQLFEKEQKLREEWAIGRLKLANVDLKSLHPLEKGIIAKFAMGLAVTENLLDQLDTYFLKQGLTPLKCLMEPDK